MSVITIIINESPTTEALPQVIAVAGLITNNPQSISSHESKKP